MGHATPQMRLWLPVSGSEIRDVLKPHDWGVMVGGQQRVRWESSPPTSTSVVHVPSGKGNVSTTSNGYTKITSLGCGTPISFHRFTIHITLSARACAVRIVSSPPLTSTVPAPRHNRLRVRDASRRLGALPGSCPGLEPRVGAHGLCAARVGHLERPPVAGNADDDLVCGHIGLGDHRYGVECLGQVNVRV